MRLVVVGDALLDHDLSGSVERLCPDAPVPVIDATHVRDRPGCAALAAWLAADYSAIEVALVTAAGSGRGADRLAQLVTEAGIEWIPWLRWARSPRSCVSALAVSPCSASIVVVPRRGRGPSPPRSVRLLPGRTPSSSPTTAAAS